MLFELSPAPLGDFVQPFFDHFAQLLLAGGLLEGQKLLKFFSPLFLGSQVPGFDFLLLLPPLLRLELKPSLLLRARRLYLRVRYLFASGCGLLFLLGEVHFLRGFTHVVSAERLRNRLVVVSPLL